MRLPGRVSAAIEILADIDRHHRPVAEALKAWGLANRFAGAGDRAAIGNLVYDALRSRASHAFAMGEDTPRAIALSVLVRDWAEDATGLAAAFASDPHAPEAPTEAELARLTAPDPLTGAPDHIRADIPEWAAPHLAEAFGDNWVTEGRSLATRPPLDLRVNSLRADRERVLRALDRLHPHHEPLLPLGIRFPAGNRDSRTPNVQVEESYLKGWFEVQDFGSQIVAQLAAPVRGGEQVLDLCAGAGGKSLALAALMQNRGQVFAYDSDRNRLAPIYDRLKRNGARNVQVRAPKLGALDEQLATRSTEQREILDSAVRYLKPGGTITYITCSVLPPENQHQVRAFLERHPDFAATPAHSVWMRHFSGSPLRARFSPEGGIALSPATTGTDGFYAVELVRSAPN